MAGKTSSSLGEFSAVPINSYEPGVIFFPTFHYVGYSKFLGRYILSFVNEFRTWPDISFRPFTCYEFD